MCALMLLRLWDDPNVACWINIRMQIPFTIRKKLINKPNTICDLYVFQL